MPDPLDPDATAAYQPTTIQPAEWFAPGTLLSGRYRVVCRI